jgi:hypothetical protein
MRRHYAKAARRTDDANAGNRGAAAVKQLLLAAALLMLRRKAACCRDIATAQPRQRSRGGMFDVAAAAQPSAQHHSPLYARAGR